MEFGSGPGRLPQRVGGLAQQRGQVHHLHAITVDQLAQQPRNAVGEMQRSLRMACRLRRERIVRKRLGCDQLQLGQCQDGTLRRAQIVRQGAQAGLPGRQRLAVIRRHIDGAGAGRQEAHDGGACVGLPLLLPRPHVDSETPDTLLRRAQARLQPRKPVTKPCPHRSPPVSSSR
ncbi:hypothetical protein UB46_25755 [Burkholderiaceae bacterium 16]|nr:hypothetical protein UB46_25755 [Burkholderiaceae bacterium 16]